MADTATNHKYVPSVPGDLTVVGKFGANGKAAQAAVVAPANATDLATSEALANAIKAALIACGIMA